MLQQSLCPLCLWHSVSPSPTHLSDLYIPLSPPSLCIYFLIALKRVITMYFPNSYNWEKLSQWMLLKIIYSFRIKAILKFTFHTPSFKEGVLFCLLCSPAKCCVWNAGNCILESWPLIFWFSFFLPVSYMRADNRGTLSVDHSGLIICPSPNVLRLLCLNRLFFFKTHGSRNINQMNIHSLKRITMWNLTEGCLTWGKLLHNMKFSTTVSKETWTHPLLLISLI